MVTDIVPSTHDTLSTRLERTFTCSSRSQSSYVQVGQRAASYQLKCGRTQCVTAHDSFPHPFFALVVDFCRSFALELRLIGCWPIRVISDH